MTVFVFQSRCVIESQSQHINVSAILKDVFIFSHPDIIWLAKRSSCWAFNHV